jgi:hypothetical protein
MCGAVVRWMPPLVSGAGRSASLRAPSRKTSAGSACRAAARPRVGRLGRSLPDAPASTGVALRAGCFGPLDAQPHVLSCRARGVGTRGTLAPHTLTGCEPPTRTQSRGRAGSAPPGLVSSATLAQLPVQLGSCHDPPGKNVVPPREGRDEDGADGRGGGDCLLGSSVVESTRARVAKLADAADLKSS